MGKKNLPLVCVVDDEPAVLEAITAQLQHRGIHPITFLRATDALAWAKTASPRPKVLVTDFLMKGVNGLELIQSWKTLYPETKTILFTGSHLDPASLTHRFQPDHRLQKPEDLKKLVTVLKEYLAEE